MNDKHGLILATGSPYKRRLMRRLNVEFTSRAPEIDEKRLDGESPDEMARRLALEKAKAIAGDSSGGWILAGDQVVACDGRIFDKPTTRRRAIDQLRRLQGTTHRLITQVALCGPDKSVTSDGVVYEMVVRPLSDEQIRRYVDEDRPLDCAGSYKIEAAGIRLFEATRGDDPTAIEGLPLTRVWTLLLEAGLAT